MNEINLSQIDDSAIAQSSSLLEIAIIGMSGRFPGAKNIEEFWQNLKDGVESVIQLSDEELLAEGVEPSLINNPNYVKANPFLEDADCFDASFFNYSPKEASLIDPQQRVFLECAWSALENAGYNSQTYQDEIAVYAGIGVNSYLVNNLASNFNFNLGDSGTFYPLVIGNGADFLSTRVSYKLNLKGSSVNVQTACSTSLVAVHLACMSLMAGECKMALAGGVSLWSPRKTGYFHQEGLVLSPDGHCRAFDAKGQGMLVGNGGGVVVLKALEDAIADGDTIHAVIKGSAINNDGNLKIGFTAPSIEGQAAVISEAQEIAEIEPESITYIEAHGTGTPLGDPMEIEALNKVFRAQTKKNGFCAIGSVKTNIGHLDAGGGIAGLIKTVLALKHRQIPPSLNFESPNPEIDFENSPFFVNTSLKEWQSNGYPRRAGVSAFGIGGTNAHVVLEEWNRECRMQNAEGRIHQSKELLLLSAKTSTALETTTVNLAEYLQKHPEVSLKDVAYTLSIGRQAFNYRRAVVVGDRKNAVKILSPLDKQKVFTNSGEIKSRSVVFMFSGQGSQYVNMAKEIYETEAVFRDEVDSCCEILKPLLKLDLRDILYPSEKEKQTATEKLKQTSIAQPALFVIEYALAKLWIHWGVKPVAMIGHSIGEYVASTLAGVFSLKDALSLVVTRGKLMQSLPSGSMLAIPLAEKEVKVLLEGTSLEIATVNTPTSCVVSGTNNAIATFQEKLVQQNIKSRLLHTSHAFHSSMMESILDPFIAEVKKIQLNPPQIPFVSNVTGTWITVEDATNPNYYAQHLRSCVRFAQGISQFFNRPEQIFLEVGAGRTLKTLAQRHPDKPSAQITLNCLPHPQEEKSDATFLLNTLGKLWLAGIEINWQNYYGQEKHYRIPLPTYPFERKRYWIEQKKPTLDNQVLGGKKSDITDWFYEPSWKRSTLATNNLNSLNFPLLIFVDELGLGSKLVEKLNTPKEKIVTVKLGETFTQLNSNSYRLNPDNSGDYLSLIKALQTQNLIPKTIVHLWNVTNNSNIQLSLSQIDASQNLGFYSLLYLAQALGVENINNEIEILVVSNNLQNVNGEENITPQKATVIGAVRVIPREYSNINCRSVDIVLPSSASRGEERLINQLCQEIRAKVEDKVIAYRGNYRWIQSFEPVSLQKTPHIPFQQKGVYLITGGMGGIGLVFAEYLAKTVQAKLVLTTRASFPQRNQWEEWLNKHYEDDPTCQKIEKIKHLESLGAEVLVITADVANENQMKNAIALSQNQFGQINGVIHCAGIPSGGVIQLKTKETVESVFAPKLQGTLILDALFKDVELDFMVVCSSLESYLGNFGQVDYCAANNFLDAYAQSKLNHNSDRLTISINWDAWQSVGMAVKTAQEGLENPTLEVKKIDHPLFDKCVVKKEQKIYLGKLSPRTHWVLGEHIIMGKPILVGTTYLEIARAAYECHTGKSTMELTDVYFLQPLIAEEDEEKQLRIILTSKEDKTEFSIQSQDNNLGQWIENAKGEILDVDTPTNFKYNIEDLEKECNQEGKLPDFESLSKFVQFSARWKNNIQWLKKNEQYHLGFLQLPQEFFDDLNTYKLHPAILDVATGCTGGIKVIEGLAYSYGKIKIQGSLPTSFYAYVTLNELNDSRFQSCNVSLLDTQGNEIIKVTNYISLKADAQTRQSIESYIPSPISEKENQLISSFEQGILPFEGVEVLNRILDSQINEILVSTQNIDYVFEQANTYGKQDFKDDLEENNVIELSQRPQLIEEYQAPENEVENAIAKVWQNFLGIKNIGINDNFFDLGGDSLLATQLISRLRAVLKLEIPLSNILKYPTIAQLENTLKQSQTLRLPPIEAKNQQENLPLSFAQERLWFLDQLEGASATYNIAYNIAINGNLNVKALQQVFCEIVNRHQTLRTSFHNIKGIPTQVINSEATIDIKFIDLQQNLEKEAQLQKEIKKSATTPFDLEDAPLIRISLLQLDSQKYILLITIHHIISDGWSMGVLREELSTLYQAFTQGKKSPLQDLPIQYADFTLWQRKWITGEILEKQLNYWKQELKDAPELLQLPTDYPRPHTQSYQGKTKEIIINNDSTEKIQNLSKKYDVTLFMTLYGVFATLLYRYSGQTDILIGSPIANRNRKEIEPLIGFFVNTLVLRTSFEDNPSFEKLLSQIKETTIKAYENQDVPFEQIVSTLQPIRSLSHSPLFQVMFVLQNAPMEKLELSDITLTEFRSDTETAKFDLLLSISQTDKGLIGSWNYNSDLFNQDTIERMASHFENLLSAIASNPQLKVNEIPILSQTEKQQILVDWNNTKADYSKDKCIHQLFEQQVIKTPNDIAVVFEEEKLTYQQLNQKSNQLAHYLRKLGVKAETLVGICCDRSLEMIIAILGILKAGGAYVPIDSNYPVERIQYMLEDSKMAILLTQEKLTNKLQFVSQNPIKLDTDWKIINQESKENIISQVSSSNLVYVIYTSGSTGKPKGVKMNHQPMVNLIEWQINQKDFNPQLKTLQFAPISFDVSFQEIFSTLCSNGTLILITEEERKDFNQLPLFLEKQSIERLFLPFIALEKLSEIIVNQPKELTKLQEVITAGEQLKITPSIEKMREKCQVIYNQYGPTETHVVSQFKLVKNKKSTYLPPIGSPISNSKIYILDSNLQPTPCCVSGEIYIGGDGLARGYLNQPELTAQKFIDNPFGEGKLYKTGDLGRYLPDGNIEFIGRIDNQVKIRGFRIELGEIENNLNQHPQIKESLVIAKSVNQNQQKDEQLIAYIIPNEKATPKFKELKKYLQEKLPEYMIPIAYIPIEKFPLTPNGKIDKKALPELNFEENRENKYIAPRNEIEVKLANIWQEVLGIEKVSINDNFFDLGGHSLLAIQLIYQISQVFQVKLLLPSLLRSPIMSELAEEIESLVNPSQSKSNFTYPTIIPNPDEKHLKFPLSNIQQAYWIGRSNVFSFGQISAHGYYEIEAQNFDLNKFTLCWQKLVQRHDMLRAVVSDDGQQRILPEVPAYEISLLDLTNKTSEEKEKQLLDIREEMSHQLLTVDEFPLFEIRASKITTNKIRLHFSLDYLIMDGYSHLIMFQELEQLYQNPNLILPELEISFRDYILAERSLINSSSYQQAREYWLNRLDNLPLAPQLPLAKNPDEIKKSVFTTYNGKLCADSWQKLKQKAAQLNLTPSAILLTAFSDVLKIWTQNLHFTLNLTFFKRLPLHPQIERIVGDFTSVMLLFLNQSEDKEFSKRAQLLQDQLWQDIVHSQFSGIEVLREIRKQEENHQLVNMPVVFTSLLPQTSKSSKNPMSWIGEKIYSISQTPQVWFDHVVKEEDEELIFHWYIVEGLFPNGLIESMFSTYIKLLDELTNKEETWQENWKNMALRLSPCPYPLSLTPQKQNNSSEYSDFLHGLFAQQAVKTPQQQAIITNSITITYQELSNKANQISAYLSQLDIKPNDLVAVVMEKGWQQVVAVLAILGTGAAYLPIEANLAEQRMAYILKEAEVKYVLTQSCLKEKLSNFKDVECFAVDDDNIWQNYSTEFVIRQKPSDLAYVIYTSGSTGKPKGVMIDHIGAVNTILDISDRFKITSEDKILALSSLSFDLSVYDIFGTLAVGGTIVIPEATKIKDPSHWVELINTHHITIWDSVPILMKLLTEYTLGKSSIKLPSLRLTLLSGDWIPLSLPQEIKQISPSTEIISLGGATEASIWSILYHIKEINPQWKTIPYGKAMKNQQVYILNEDLIPCPPCVSGSIYIGGVGLSLGYFRQEEKTANSFITHPLTQQRLYRTGDRGRYLPDGNIEFLGREDFQVKIQGNRIELAEIELNLTQNELVELAVVNAIGEKDQEKTLIAYIKVNQSLPLISQEKLTEKLLTLLKQKLPSYMIPHHVMVLEEFPLNANGKIDRKALPLPLVKEKLSSQLSTLNFDNSLPTQISEIVADILNLEKINIDKDWLKVGATSVDMIRIANALEETFDYRLDFDQLYQQPNAIAIAQILTQKLGLTKTLESKNISIEDKAKYTIIKDPQQRQQFKAKQLGIRQDENLLSSLSLTKSNQKEKEREYQQRRSVKTFSQEIISLENFSQFLACLSQINSDKQNAQYLYPSAGGLYPVQTYLHIKVDRIENISAGIYYYNPLTHNLDKISSATELDANIHEKLVNRPVYESSAFSVFFIAQMKAILPMYGELAKDFCLLEAGYMAQLMMIKSKQYNLGLCPIGAIKFGKIRDLFQLDEEHLLLHSLLGGKLISSTDNLDSQSGEIVNYYNFDEASDSLISTPTKLSNNREEIEI